MTVQPEELHVPRLIESDSEAGRLLKLAMRSEPPVPSEAHAWNRLRERRQTNRTRLVWIPVAAAMACAAAFLLVRRNNDAERPTARAEVWVNARDVVQVTPTARVNEVRPLAATAPAPELAALSAKSTSKESPLASAAPRETTEDTERCGNAARNGQLDEAMSCYDAIARGRSMASELALYEKARLESRALGNQAQALRSLDEHQSRFPNGVLSTEVALTRIELLTRLGRGSEALRAIDSALIGSMGRERGADLHALRGDHLSAQGDCERALADYAQAERLGAHPSRLAAGMKRCEPSEPRSLPNGTTP